jgi:hypothetical protein
MAVSFFYFWMQSLVSNRFTCFCCCSHFLLALSVDFCIQNSELPVYCLDTAEKYYRTGNITAKQFLKKLANPLYGTMFASD